MKKEIKIKVPNSWKGISLKKYLEMYHDVETYRDEPEAFVNIIFLHLCNITPDVLQRMSNADREKIQADVMEFMSDTYYDLQRIVTIDGKEYGFEPNLAEMAYGAYLDIASIGELKINKDWAKVMSILYRPVNKKNGAVYSIEPYNGNIDEKKWLEVGMDIHFGVLTFFLNISNQLPSAILNSLVNQKN